MLRLTNEQGQALITYLATQTDVPEPLVTVLRQLEEQFSNSRYTVDLIDELHEILNDPRSRLRLHNDSLTALRASIFSPRELNNLKTLAKNSIGCASCGRKLHGLTTADRANVYCTRCTFAESIGCRGCGYQLALPRSFLSMLEKLFDKCPGCRTRMPDVPPAPERMTPEQAAEILGNRPTARQRAALDPEMFNEQVNQAVQDTERFWNAQIPRGARETPPAPRNRNERVRIEPVTATNGDPMWTLNISDTNISIVDEDE